MNQSNKPMRLITVLGVLAATLYVSGCERPPIDSKQTGYRGTGMAVFVNPRTDALMAETNQVPVALPAASADGPKAKDVYQNVQVLTDLSVGQFTRLMVSMTQWVAPPDQSCNYCHGAEMASDAKYTKVVARRMLQMTRHINNDWKSHVAATGVTCYTCHRGHVVPQYVWFKSPATPPSGLVSTSMVLPVKPDRYTPQTTLGNRSLFIDPYEAYLLENQSLRINATTALPGGPTSSIQEATSAYALMTHISTALGVDCEYCHNMDAPADWSRSTPKRVTAWYGLAMVRGLNNDYLAPLATVFPSQRLGVLGDTAKVNCATCHQGLFKPLYGVSMAKDYPELY
jgi:photosynthetic reaction center cytochrome c subunit